MKTKLFMTLPFLLAAAALFYGCKEDAFDNDGNDITPNYTYHITAAATAAGGDTAANSKARSLMLNPTRDVVSRWETGDQLLAFNNTDADGSSQTAYSLLTVAPTGNGQQNSAFDGNIVSKRQISTSDLLCFLYPGSASTGTDRTIKPVVRKTGTNPDGKPFYYYGVPDDNKIKHLVMLNLSHQDGTITTLGKKYDYQWKAVRPTAVNGTTVQCSVGAMQRKIAIWGLRFKDPNGNAMADIDSIKIANVTSSDVLDLGTGNFVTDNNIPCTVVSLRPVSGKFSCALGDYVYAAVLPGTYTDVRITVWKGTDRYIKTYHQMTLEANKSYQTNVKTALDAPEQGNKLPYVEVQGVKWAKGNFIHYKDVPTQAEYWGIAPTQWYISGWGFTTPNGQTSTSQFLFNPEQNPNDLDLFRWGDIADALDVHDETYKAYWSYNMAKEFFDKGPGHTIVPRDRAKFGDIAYYYTYYNRQRYCLPSDADMRKLFEKANVKPAFCFTPNGNKIYGAYFWTCNTGESRTQLFPTQRLGDYEDVTQQVRNDEGLFLPMTGLRYPMMPQVIYRNVANKNAYGQYMTDRSNALNNAQYFFFGQKIWSFANAAIPKSQATAIRPVWVDSVTGNTTANSAVNFAPFQGIY